jgi:hypothetical protein
MRNSSRQSNRWLQMPDDGGCRRLFFYILFVQNKPLVPDDSFLTGEINSGLRPAALKTEKAVKARI